jgi:hypothetical protein
MSFFMFAICFWSALALVACVSPLILLAARCVVAAASDWSSQDGESDSPLSYDSAPMSWG